MDASSCAVFRPLDLLPPELVLSILSNLSIADLSAFRQAAKTCNNFVNQSENAIYRILAFNLGLTQPQSAGATQAVLAPPAPMRAQDQQQELEGIVRQQQSMSTYFDGVADWKDFGQCGERQA